MSQSKNYIVKIRQIEKIVSFSTNEQQFSLASNLSFDDRKDY